MLRFIAIIGLIISSCSISSTLDYKNFEENKIEFIATTNVCGILKFIGNEPFTTLNIDNKIDIYPKNLSNDLVGSKVQVYGDLFRQIINSADNKIHITNFYMTNIISLF